MNRRANLWICQRTCQPGMQSAPRIPPPPSAEISDCVHKPTLTAEWPVRPRGRLSLTSTAEGQTVKHSRPKLTVARRWLSIGPTSPTLTQCWASVWPAFSLLQNRATGESARPRLVQWTVVFMCAHGKLLNCTKNVSRIREEPPKIRGLWCDVCTQCGL